MPSRRSIGRNFINRVRHATIPRLHLLSRLQGISIASTATAREWSPFPNLDSFEYVPSVESFERDIQLETTRPCTPVATVSLRDLPIIAIDEISRDERFCHICHEPYLDGDEPEDPVDLPCGHIVGKACISRWLSPDDMEPKSSCPICRMSFFDNNFHNWGSLEGGIHDEVWNNVSLAGRTEEDLFHGWSGMQFPRSAAEATYQMQNFDQDWSGLILSMNNNGPYVPRQYPNARTTQEVLETFQRNSTLTYWEAIALGEEMGQLFIRLRTTMRLLRFLPAWNEFGPSARDLMSPESRVVMETALRRLVYVEEAWVWAQRGV